jgi:hypothetical protein
MVTVSAWERPEASRRVMKEGAHSIVQWIRRWLARHVADFSTKLPQIVFQLQAITGTCPMSVT